MIRHPSLGCVQLRDQNVIFRFLPMWLWRMSCKFEDQEFDKHTSTSGIIISSVNFLTEHWACNFLTEHWA